MKSRSDRVWAAAWRAAAVLVLVTMGVSVVPDEASIQGILLYLVPVALSVALCVVAVARIPRPDRAPWLWIAASQLLFLAGEFVSARYELIGSDTWPTPAEAFFLTGQIAVVAGVLAINRRRSEVTHRGDLLDSAIVAASVGVLAMVFLVLPSLIDDRSSLVGRLVSSSYPVFDVVLVYLMVRMILTPAGRAPAYWALLGAQLAMLGADLGWNVESLITESEDYSWWANLLWQAGYLLLALAACGWKSSATNPPGHPAREGGALSELRLVVLTIASLAPSVILVALNIRSGIENPGWLGVGSILLGGLVAARIWDLLQQLRAQTARIAELAAQDPLTGLPNRRSWDEQTERACRPGLADGRTRIVALIDLDRFKAYNDQHGHQSGDHLLQAAAAAWRDVLDGEGFLARWGGEEFAVLLIDHRPERALSILERLRAVVPAGQTCSVGVAVWDGSETPDAALHRADQALYAAKSGGRDRLVLAADDRVAGEAAPTPSLSTH